MYVYRYRWVDLTGLLFQKQNHWETHHGEIRVPLRDLQSIFEKGNLVSILYFLETSIYIEIHDAGRVVTLFKKEKSISKILWLFVKVKSS